MKKLLILNGPNINMTGKRQKHIYGEISYGEMVKQIKSFCRKTGFYASVKQRNCEGRLIDIIQKSEKKFCALIINPGAYSHYSYAIMDALYSISIPKIEVHLSDVLNREDFRKNLITAKACDCIISGRGIDSYIQAVRKAAELI